MTRKKKAPDGDQPESFEASLDRLEQIVARMESGALGLEEMMACFEEGQRLIGVCSAKLNEVEKKIEILVSKGGQVEAEPFADGEESEEEPADEESASGDDDRTGRLF